jgi:Protein of unknown function (DUF1619)
MQLSTDPYYDQNDTIAAFSNSSLFGLVTGGSGFFEIPLADFTGKCNDNNFVKFERDVSSSSCTRDIPFESFEGFQNLCVTGFSVQKYVTNLFVAR